jgi:hypothetical protein
MPPQGTFETIVQRQWTFGFDGFDDAINHTAVFTG